MRRETSSQGPRLVAVLLPGFNDIDLESVRRGFQSAAPCHLGQAWEVKESEGFAPALVRVGWWRKSLLVYAELTDADIFTQASGLNERMWELGDAFEIFLRPDGDEAYVEFQVTPNNQRLQLRYANTAALNRARKTGSVAEALIAGDAFRSKTWI